MKLTEYEARFIMDAWKADDRYSKLRNLPVLNGTYFPAGGSVRVWLPGRNKIASDALWDGLDNRAFKALVTLGVSKKAVLEKGTGFYQAMADANRIIGSGRNWTRGKRSA